MIKCTGKGNYLKIITLYCVLGLKFRDEITFLRKLSKEKAKNEIVRLGNIVFEHAVFNTSVLMIILVLHK